MIVLEKVAAPDIVIVELAANVVNAPAARVVPPIGVFCMPLDADVIVPPTFKFSLTPTPPVTTT
jgi:hypothetical protein